MTAEKFGKANFSSPDEYSKPEKEQYAPEIHTSMIMQTALSLVSGERLVKQQGEIPALDLHGFTERSQFAFGYAEPVGKVQTGEHGGAGGVEIARATSNR
jgi:hypothetical protein